MQGRQGVMLEKTPGFSGAQLGPPSMPPQGHGALGKCRALWEGLAWYLHRC